MIYLLALGLFVWLLGYADDRTGLRYNNHKNYLLVAGSVVALTMGLRTQFTGSPDTYAYMVIHDDMVFYEDFRTFYEQRLSENNFLFSEAGFYLMVWLIQKIFGEGHMLVFLTSVFITWSTCFFVYKNTKDVPLAMLIYVCLGLFAFNMNGMRQAMAMSVCLWAYVFVKKRKIFPFILTVLLAMLFHRTAICFLPVYFLPALKKGNLNTFLYFCGMVVFLMTMEWFIETFNDLTGKEYTMQDEADSGGISVLLIYAVAILLPLLRYSHLEDRQIRVQFFCVVLGFVCYITRYMANVIMERLSYYFFYFTLLLIPNVMDHLKEDERKIVKIIFAIGAILLFWYRLQGGSFRNFKFYFM